MIKIPLDLKPILEELKNKGISPVLVGGFVRDSLLQITSKDIDIELYNVNDFESIHSIISSFGKPNLVGKSFGVLKLSLKNLEIDFSLPRLEKKVGSGHKGFEVTLDSMLSFKEAAKRRDFTINAMGYDYNAETLFDPYGGASDLQNKRLHYVDEDTFIEDPLRVFRAIQFCARFELTCSDELILLCKKIIKSGELKFLSKERIFEEIAKLFLKAQSPSIGLKLFNSFSLQVFFPQLTYIDFHSLDNFAKNRGDESKRDLILMLVLLVFHIPTNDEVEEFLEIFISERQIKESVLNLYKYRYVLQDLEKKGFKNYDLLLLSSKVNIENLLLIDSARGYDFKELKTVASNLNVLSCKPKPLLQGRDLIELGLKPSEHFSSILEFAFDAQLQEVYKTPNEAKEWLQKNLQKLLKEL